MPLFQFIRAVFSLLRDAWLIAGTTILLVLAGHYALGIADFLKDSLAAEPPEIDSRVNSPVYDDFADKHAFWEEHLRTWDTRFEPYSHWRRKPFAGKYTNVDEDGIRLTVKGDLAPAPTRVFMYGGSTLWGTGVADGETIPSRLQALLGSNYDVYNYGETGYVSAQELNHLLQRLATGDIPDVVIFYDGVNDGYVGAYSPAIPRDPQGLRGNENKRREQNWWMAALEKFYEESNYNRLLNYLGMNLFSQHEAAGSWDTTVESRIGDNSARVLDIYEAHIRQVTALADEYGFTALFFWQPNLFSLTRKANEYEQSVVDAASPVWVASQQEVYRLARARLSGREEEGVFFIGNLFDAVDEPVYIDWCHIGPAGNRLVAKAMFDSF